MKTAYIYNIFQRLAFLAAVFVLIALSFLSTYIPFGGQTVADVHAKYETLITPAGYAYIIWGFIYVCMGIFAVFQLHKGKNTRFFRLVYPLFLINVLSNILWLIAFQHELLGLSTLFIFITLATLVVIFQKFYRLKKALGTTHRYFFQMPFSLYFGWITITTLVNMAAAFNGFNINLPGNLNEILSVFVLIVVAFIGLYILINKEDYIYAFAMIWGFVAIGVGQVDVKSIATVSKVSAIVLLVAMIIKFVAYRIKMGQYGHTAST